MSNLNPEDILFNDWNKVKKKLHNEKRSPFFHEGEIWWCGIGKNIGVEAYGKKQGFSRPILIYRKLSSASFLGICLTSQPHAGSWYVQYHFKGKIKTINLAQIRTISTFRLYRKIGEIDEKDMATVRNGFHNLYF